MRARNPAALGILLALALAAPIQGRAFSFTESWYMGRGKANLEIGNYKAAIEAFEKVVETDPANSEAIRLLATAYEKQGLGDKAVEEYDRYLERHPEDYEVAFKQAQTLEWSRYSYRREDALKYYRMGLARKDDPVMRLRYARLLAARKDTNAEAIRQYQRVLRKQPRNVEAHEGLARAYAWEGENDLALEQKNLAERYRGSSDPDLASLDRDLMKGREPAIGAGFHFLAQTGDGYTLSGFGLETEGKRDLSPFLTANARMGYEDYWSPTQSGGIFSVGLGAQYRLNPNRRVELDLGYHAFGNVTTTGVTQGRGAIPGQSSGDVTFRVQYFDENADGLSFRPGFRRELRYDSFTSLFGTPAGGVLLGAARSNQFFTDFEFSANPFRFTVTPFAGWITTADLSPNAQLGIQGVAELPLIQPRSGSEGFSLTAMNDVYLTHYGEDQSGMAPSTTEPLPGGYFSPQLFLSETPKLRAEVSLSDRTRASLEAGPSLQLVRDAASNGSAWNLGAQGLARVEYQFSERLSWKNSAAFNQVAGVYNQFQLESALTYRF